MAKNTSISLGDHFEGLINEQVMEGRYGSASEVIRQPTLTGIARATTTGFALSPDRR